VRANLLAWRVRFLREKKRWIRRIADLPCRRGRPGNHPIVGADQPPGKHLHEICCAARDSVVVLVGCVHG